LGKATARSLSDLQGRRAYIVTYSSVEPMILRTTTQSAKARGYAILARAVLT